MHGQTIRITEDGGVCCSVEYCRSRRVLPDTPANRRKIQIHSRQQHGVFQSTVTSPGGSRSITYRCGALCLTRTERSVVSKPAPCKRPVIKRGDRCFEH